MDPHLLTVANVTQSIKDSAGIGSLSTDNFTVEVRSGGQIVVVSKPYFRDEQNFITMAARDSLVIVKAVKGWYAGVTLIHMQLDADFRDGYGNTSSAPGAWLEFRSDTIAKMNPDGLEGRAYAQPTDLFAIADAHYIDPAIWKHITAEHRTALRVGGTPFINPIPQ